MKKIRKILAKINLKREMITRKIKRGRIICIISVGEVNVIITYTIPKIFIIIKYSSVNFISN